MKRAVPFVIATAVFIAGFLSLGRYNVTWDEALGDLFFGQRYLSFFTSFDSRYLDFRADPYPPGYAPDLTSSPFRTRPWEHYPVASTLATATSRMLWGVLGIVDPFDGYHAFNLLMAAIFIVVFYRFVEDGWGPLAATSSTLLLFLSPRIAGDVMANVKDFSEMVFFSVAAILFFRAWEKESVRGIVLAGVVWGLALGTKANALFLPAIVVLYVIWSGGLRATVQRKRILLLLAWGAVGATVFFISWPYLWQDPIRTLRSNLIYLLARKSGTLPQNTAGAFAMIALTTPLPFLFAFAVGVAPLLERLRERNRHAILVTSWIAVIVARLALPAAVNFDGVRHFLELFPPMAAVCGAAVVWIASRLAQPIARAAVAVVVIIATAVPLVRIHPFESAYWNLFAGGLNGAMKRQFPQAGDYWAASYRIGINWLNANAPPNSTLVVPVAEHTVRIVAPYRLRPDIHLAHITNAWSPKVDMRAFDEVRMMSDKQPVFVMFILRRDWSNAVMMESFARYKPAAAWGTDGAPVLVIFRMTLNK